MAAHLLVFDSGLLYLVQFVFTVAFYKWTKRSKHGSHTDWLASFSKGAFDYPSSLKSLYVSELRIISTIYFLFIYLIKKW